MAKCCKTPPELNSLGRMWYCVFVVCTFLYLLIDAVKRYTYYNTTEWPEDGKPSTQLTFYIILITISLLAILAFVPTQILQIGNAPNDDKKLGKKQHEKKFDMGYDARKGPGRARRMLKHVGPVGATLHVFSAFCLLLPILLLQSAEIEQSRLPAEAIWSTELDFIFGSSYKSVALVTDFEAMSTPVPTAAKEVTAYNFYANPSVSIAFLNYLIPLFLYAVRFADIFSITHRLFSVIFATELVLIAINKNVAKQEAIMRAMKQLQSTEDTGSLDRRMQKNPLHKSQDSLNRERDTLKKQSPKVQSAHTAGTLPKASPALPAKKSDSKRNSLASASSKDAEIQG
uniref:Uncharacterized protein LOC102805948 n=1 Tax=Saccoglossus kowalevskii TaxID=10224 RepID=A0ABM0MSJ2_SACKO|nr:PREDICTED: uncharacterized protein LOC102805948 [Saccoglossus kowalevskii]